MMQAQWHETRAHVMQNYQCIVRRAVKLRFLLGLAHEVAETNGILGFPQTRETRGLLAAKAANMEALVIAMEAAGENFRGTFVPDRRLLVAAQTIAQTTYPEIVEAIRGNAYRFEDWAKPRAMVEDFMASYGQPQAKATAE
jgi:4-hydroxyphenylacetate 3-monooxygenase